MLPPLKQLLLIKSKEKIHLYADSPPANTGKLTGIYLHKFLEVIYIFKAL